MKRCSWWFGCRCCVCGFKGLAAGFIKSQPTRIQKTDGFWYAELVRWLRPLNPCNSPMARPNATDPLIPLPVRLPTSTVERLRAEATAAGVSLSDVLRSHLTLAEAKPLGKPRPRRREPTKLGAVSGADPVLLRALSGIGNNMNQIARRAGNFPGASTMQCVEVLVILRAIESELTQIAERHAR